MVRKAKVPEPSPSPQDKLLEQVWQEALRTPGFRERVIEKFGSEKLTPAQREVLWLFEGLATGKLRVHVDKNRYRIEYAGSRWC